MSTANGLLIDITRCVGCRECERACAEANRLAYEEGERDLSATRYTAVRSFRNDEVFVRRLCMRCDQPTCVSACPVGAFQKTETGAVLYDESKCLGCRYCMQACPFEVPRYEWGSLTPRVQKCRMCYERVAGGGKTACAEACPTQATLFGDRAELVREERRRIDETLGWLMGRQLVRDAQNSFKGGLNTTAADLNISADEARQLENLHIDEFVSAEKRRGTRRPSTAVLTANPILGGYSWNRAGASILQVSVCTNTGLYYGGYTALPVTFTLVAGGMSASVRPYLKAFRDNASNEVVFIADGGLLNYFNGTALTENIASTPNARVLEVYNQRLFGITGTDQTLYWSKLNDGTTLTAASSPFPVWDLAGPDRSRSRSGGPRGWANDLDGSFQTMI